MFFFEHHGMESEDFYRVSSLSGISFPLHLHRAFELIFVRDGSLTLKVDQHTHQLQRHDLAFIFPTQLHSFTSSESAKLSVVLFSPEIIGDFYAVCKGTVPENCVLALNERLDFDAPRTLYAQKSLLYHLCDELLHTTQLVPVENHGQTEVVQRVFTYVDRHYHEPCTLKDVARALQYDYAYLSKLFANMAGVRFTAYLNHTRIAQACALLRAGQKTVSEIATACGYTTLRTFHRNFKAVTSQSPKEYLASIAGQR